MQFVDFQLDLVQTKMQWPLYKGLFCRKNVSFNRLYVIILILKKWKKGILGILKQASSFKCNDECFINHLLYFCLVV